jgi:hypothetical protein
MRRWHQRLEKDGYDGLRDRCEPGRCRATPTPGPNRRRIAELVSTSPERPLEPGESAFYSPALYVLLNPFRALVTVKEPSSSAESLIQYALPLWIGAGGAPGPGAGVGAMGTVGCWSSIVFAINIPGTVYSFPLKSENASARDLRGQGTNAGSSSPQARPLSECRCS